MLRATVPLGANVLAVDYRGFGDSGGGPSEAGVSRDARAVALEADPGDVMLWGECLGTDTAYAGARR